MKPLRAAILAAGFPSLCRPMNARALPQRSVGTRMGRSVSAVGLILLLHVGTSGAQTLPPESKPASESKPNQAVEVIAKGVVGNLLDVVPLHAEDRAQLQRLNAVVGSPLSARTLAIALGVSSPPLMIIGLIWGLWSATQISPKDSDVQPGDAVLQKRSPGGDPDITVRSPIHGAATANASQTLHTPDATDRTATVSAAATSENVHDALQRMARNVEVSTLASVVGGASGTEKGVPCDYCIMPMLYPRDTAMPR